MSSNWLEQSRSVLESIELIEKVMVELMFEKNENSRETIMVDNKLKNLIEMKQSKCMDALIILQDFDGARKEELLILEGKKSVIGGNRQPDVWINFTQRLKDIQDYHKKHSTQNTQVQIIDKEFYKKSVFLPPYSEPLFTADEGNGKYLDMNFLYYEFLSFDLKKKKVRLAEDYHIGDYSWFLEKFDAFEEIPLALKIKEYNHYRDYLSKMIVYLKDFFNRIRPLTEYPALEKLTLSEFESQWVEGAVLGWPRTNYDDIIDVENNELYCQACKKLFTNSSIYAHHLEGKRHKANMKAMDKEAPKSQNKDASNESGDKSEKKDEIQRKVLAKLEFLAKSLKNQLSDIVQDTILYIKKKQTRTFEEIEAENEQQNKEVDHHSDSEDDEMPYNPKNVPLGPDGKPIPYWLYKLHGLGIEYKCEICGNFSYWGRRAFEKHFGEWRHTYGMKCLKIPNTVHFKEITSIKDAFALYNMLSQQSESSQFNRETEEEFEDSDGNILNKKTYNDLKKQGLL